MNNRAYFIILLFVAWSLISWHYYTCTIKGFCGAPAVTASSSKSVDAETSSSTGTVEHSDAATPCSPYITTSIRRGAENDPADVRRLETFLNAHLGTQLPVDGVYDEKDEAAVREFQTRYAADVLTPWGITQPTGYVHTTTREKINALHCAQQ